MNALLTSTAIVALAEMGDKTQLLAFTLAARFQRPWPVLGGILAATILNHGLAATFGATLASWLGPQVLRWVVGLSFLGFAVWTLVPDQDEDVAERPGWGPFATTAILFFVAEMGDKTQLATVALGARFQAVVAVTCGTTLGMMIADGAAVVLGTRLPTLIPMHWMRRLAATLFAAFGLITLFWP